MKIQRQHQHTSGVRDNGAFPRGALTQIKHHCDDFLRRNNLPTKVAGDCIISGPLYSNDKPKTLRPL